MTKDIVSKAQETANKALATINPEQYVATVYEPFKSRVSKAIESVKDLKYDITTTAGMEDARKARAMFREIRIDADKERKARKEPLLVIGRLLESGNNAIADEVEPYENKFDADIKAEEKRKDDIKAEEVRKEAERVAAIEAKVNEIKNAPIEAVNLDSVGTQAVVDRLSVIVPTSEVYQERTVEVEILLEQTIKTLNQMADGKRAQEQLAHQQKLAAEETARVSYIKSKVAEIRNAILDGAEIEESAKLKELIDKVEQTAINSEVYQEFTDEAIQSRETVIKALKRQFDALVNAEKIAEQVKAENNRAVEPGSHRADYVEAQPINEVKPLLSESESAPNTQDQVAQSASNLTHLPKAMEAEFGKVFQPTAHEIVQIVARAKQVDEQLAHKWLLNTDFATMMQKAA